MRKLCFFFYRLVSLLSPSYLIKCHCILRICSGREKKKTRWSHLMCLPVRCSWPRSSNSIKFIENAKSTQMAFYFLRSTFYATSLFLSLSLSLAIPSHTLFLSRFYLDVLQQPIYPISTVFFFSISNAFRAFFQVIARYVHHGWNCTVNSLE